MEITSKPFFIFLLVLSVITVNAQTQKFDYKSKNGRLDFTSIRTFVNDTVFTDNGLLCSDTSEICSITFKKIKSTWFVLVSGQWQDFFSSSDSLIQVVYFKNEKFILKPIGHSLEYNDVNLYGCIKEDLYIHSGHISTLWFDPNLGVVIIDGDEQLITQCFAKEK